MSVIDEIKTRIDIVDLVSETVQLRRSGKNYSGFCPFHPNQRTPAFVVFPETGTWRCFGQCNEGGDIFRFVMKKEGWDFPETLHYLAERAGVQLQAASAEQQAAAEEHDQLRALLEDAVIFYRHQLQNTAAGKPALDYLLQKRGLQEGTLEAFGIGYAPHAWDATLQYFLSKGYRLDDLLAAGMITEREPGRGEAKGGTGSQAELGRSGGTGSQAERPGEAWEGRSGRRLERSDVYDRFRNRIMIPIRDARGRMAGFGARILNPDDVPKFLNSPQTPVFDKGRLLYGLDRAKKAIRTQDQAVIVEGYLDVIALHQAGFENAVSPMGTALTEHQLYLLKRYSRRIILALDPDAAGDKATLRGLQIARQAMDHEQDPVFDARGLLGHEARLQADIRVTTLPEGMDPDEVVNRDPREWEGIIENARPVVIHVMETLAAGRDLEDPKVKDEIAAQVIPLIEDVPSPIERDTYRQRLARLIHVDERTLMEIAPRPVRSRASGRRPQGQATAPPRKETAKAAVMSSYALEGHCLGILLRNPGLLYQVDRQLQQEGLARLSAEDFEHTDHRAIMQLFQDSIDQDLAEPQNFVFNSLSLPMMELADDLLERTSRLDPGDERVLDDLMRGLLDLRKRKLHQEIEFRKFAFEEIEGGTGSSGGTGSQAGLGRSGGTGSQAERPGEALDGRSGGTGSPERDNVAATQQSQYMVQLAKAMLLIDRARAKYTGRAPLAR